MAAIVIDGKAIAADMCGEMRQDAESLSPPPYLYAVIVGEDPASALYVRNKQRACNNSGIRSTVDHLPAETTQAELLDLIARLNADSDVDGILVQSPVPDHIDETAVLRAINPAKDVDCFHPENVGLMVAGAPRFLPCTPAGIQQLLIRSGIETEGRHAVVVGRSNIVGKPMANMLLQKQKGANATVTICHTRTTDMAHYTRQADILVVAAGRPNTITGDMVKPGAAVIDVGSNMIKDQSVPQEHRFVGDVAYDEVAEVAGWITPVPGGVGPMTIAMLLHNTLTSAKLRSER
jgi:methylenetetrahydrofolate dehydrogenase (NADP+) / methenyltetrahydrofolate cyclohydrolase